MQGVPGNRPRIVFVGAGHASLIALTRLGPLPDAEVTLVSDGPHAHYSGMVPGWIEGLYDTGAMTIPLAPFAARVGARFLDARLIGAQDGMLRLSTGELGYDILVLNIGAVATPPLEDAPVIPAKPFPRLIAGLAPRLETARSFAVIGAGAAGTEVALALARRRPDAAIALVEQGEAILAPFPAAFRRRVRRHLDAAGIRMELRARLAAADGSRIVLADGREIASECTLAFTGAAAPPALAATPFARAADGFLATDDRLALVSHPNVLAVGDVATRPDDPRPKAGVFAVRAGPPLAQAVAALAAGRRPPRTTLQRRALVLLATGGRRAIGVRNGIVLEGRAVWWLKDRLDRTFVDHLNGAT